MRERTRLQRLHRIPESKAMEKKEKDRFGENAKFDERANEDTYFAVKEHELIEEMKTEFQKREAGRREGHIVNCPKCPGKLERFEFMGFVLDRCAQCEGVWLDKGELDGIVRRAARGPLGAFLDRCFAKDENQKKSTI